MNEAKRKQFDLLLDIFQSALTAHLTGDNIRYLNAQNIKSDMIQYLSKDTDVLETVCFNNHIYMRMPVVSGAKNPAQHFEKALKQFLEEQLPNDGIVISRMSVKDDDEYFLQGLTKQGARVTLNDRGDGQHLPEIIVDVLFGYRGVEE